MSLLQYEMMERVGDISQYFPRRRICDPAQMDSALLYLVSPSSECVTGTCIKIDDGQGTCRLPEDLLLGKARFR